MKKKMRNPKSSHKNTGGLPIVNFWLDGLPAAVSADGANHRKVVYL